jgi:general stress protein CsbA
VHYFAHKLQLALVAASREAKYVHQFFFNLNFIINIVLVLQNSMMNCKLLDQVAEIESMIVSNGIETGRGTNQTGTLQ